MCCLRWLGARLFRTVLLGATAIGTPVTFVTRSRLSPFGGERCLPGLKICLSAAPPLPSSMTLGLLRVREKSTFSESQRTTLEQAYRCKPYVDYQRRMELAMNIGLSEEQVRIWFQNRRAKDRQVAKRRTEPSDRLYSPKAASSSGTPWWTNSSPK